MELRAGGDRGEEEGPLFLSFLGLCKLLLEEAAAWALGCVDFSSCGTLAQ